MLDNPNMEVFFMITVLPTECSCKRCSLMCQGPCCGLVSDMKMLIDKGYGNRLMLDDIADGDAPLLKPALKGYEGKKAPWSTRMPLGCPFWKKGKCELHESGLK